MFIIIFISEEGYCKSSEMLYKPPLESPLKVLLLHQHFNHQNNHNHLQNKLSECNSQLSSPSHFSPWASPPILPWKSAMILQAAKGKWSTTAPITNVNAPQTNTGSTTGTNAVINPCLNPNVLGARNRTVQKIRIIGVNMVCPPLPSPPLPPS